MTAYAVAHVHTVDPCPDIVEYLQRIDGTLDLFGGRFLVHGNEIETVEGEWSGDLILIQFPDWERLTGWYHSDEYREIAPLRTKHMVADIILVPGVAEDYRASDALNH